MTRRESTQGRDTNGAMTDLKGCRLGWLVFLVIPVLLVEDQAFWVFIHPKNLLSPGHWNGQHRKLWKSSAEQQKSSQVQQDL